MPAFTSPCALQRREGRGHTKPCATPGGGTPFHRDTFRALALALPAGRAAVGPKEQRASDRCRCARQPRFPGG